MKVVKKVKTCENRLSAFFMEPTIFIFLTDETSQPNGQSNCALLFLQNLCTL